MSNFVNLMDIVYPVGSIYQSMNATSPASSIGGTWTQLKTFLYGANTANQTGGEATHTLTVNEMPSHAHDVSINIQHVDGASVSLESLTSGLQVGGRRRYFDSTSNVGGGKHTTTCHPTQLALSGIAQRNFTESKQSKSKRGGVCLTTLTSWILSTPLGQYLSQIRQSRQQIQLAGHGQNSIVTRLSAAERQIQLAAQIQLDLPLTRCLRTITELLDGANGLALIIKTICELLLMVEEIGIRRMTQLKTLAEINLLTTAPSIGLLTSISAQPSYMLGGVA